MRKTLTYSVFTIVSILVVLIFVTARSYVQLGAAILLYPAAAYFALKIFGRKNWKAPKIEIQLPVKLSQKVKGKTAPELKKEVVEVADIDKRTFLKLIGATGLSFLIFSILGRKVDTLLFSGSLQNGLTAPTGLPGEAATGSSSPMDGYKIAEIDDGAITYYGFTNVTGGWLIMREDTDVNSFRYIKGDLNFPSNWAGRENLKYDYYHNVF